MAVVITACGGESGPRSSQRWGDIIVYVETRPAPVRAGMNEILVELTDVHGRAGSELIVSMRARDDEAWKQLIQDGLSGVFRRAIKLEQGNQTLQLELRDGDRQQTLYFPLGNVR